VVLLPVLVLVLLVLLVSAAALQMMSTVWMGP
jgi:hypothetical protein